MNTSTPYFKDYIKRKKYIKIFEIGTEWISTNSNPFVINIPFKIESCNPITTFIRYRYQNNTASTRYLEQFIDEYERGNLHLL